MKRLRNVNGNTTYIYKEISFITILDVTTRRQSIANPPMEDSYGRLHMNIDVREIKQVVNILHMSLTSCLHLYNIYGLNSFYATIFQIWAFILLNQQVILVTCSCEHLD